MSLPTVRGHDDEKPATTVSGSGPLPLGMDPAQTSWRYPPTPPGQPGGRGEARLGQHDVRGQYCVALSGGVRSRAGQGDFSAEAGSMLMLMNVL
jgi:hypothetical protein